MTHLQSPGTKQTVENLVNLDHLDTLYNWGNRIRTGLKSPPRYPSNHLKSTNPQAPVLCLQRNFIGMYVNMNPVPRMGSWTLNLFYREDSMAKRWGQHGSTRFRFLTGMSLRQKKLGYILPNPPPHSCAKASLIRAVLVRLPKVEGWHQPHDQ